MPPRHQRADARFQRAIGAGDGEERMAFAELASFANVEEGDFRPVVHQGLGLRRGNCPAHACRSEEHTSELQSLMRISYAVFCLKKKKQSSLHINSLLASNNTHN